MTLFHLYRSPLNRSRGLLVGANLALPCALGRSGVKPFKREGDGATPLSPLTLNAIHYRGDRWHQKGFRLPHRIIRAQSGWCDDPRAARYNRAIPLPSDLSHEKMWRDDHLYDLVIETSWNSRPAIRGRGSAIFIHLARPGYAPTEGCLAFSKKDLTLLLRHLDRNTRIMIV